MASDLPSACAHHEKLSEVQFARVWDRFTSLERSVAKAEHLATERMNDANHLAEKFTIILNEQRQGMVSVETYLGFEKRMTEAIARLESRIVEIQVRAISTAVLLSAVLSVLTALLVAWLTKRIY